MEKKSLKNILKKTAVPVLLCAVALGATVGITRREKPKQQESNEVMISPDPLKYSDFSQTVMSDKNAKAATKREEVLSVAEYVPYEEEAKAEEFVLNWPVAGDIVMDFSDDELVFDATLEQYRTNDSVSISARVGEEVVSSAEGRVKEITKSREKGVSVILDHENGWQTTYSQLKENLAVNVGDRVKAGEVLGEVNEPSLYGAALGSHVDFKVTLNDTPIDPKTAVGENLGE